MGGWVERKKGRKDGRTYRWIDEREEGQMEGGVDEWKDGWVAEWLEERKRGREGVWMMERQTNGRKRGMMGGRTERWVGNGWREQNPLILTFWCLMENLKVPPASPGPGRSQSSVSKLTSMRL